MVNGIARWFRPRDRRDLELMAARYGAAAVALVSGWGAAIPAADGQLAGSTTSWQVPARVLAELADDAG